MLEDKKKMVKLLDEHNLIMKQYYEQNKFINNNGPSSYVIRLAEHMNHYKNIPLKSILSVSSSCGLYNVKNYSSFFNKLNSILKSMLVKPYSVIYSSDDLPKFTKQIPFFNIIYDIFDVIPYKLVNSKLNLPDINIYFTENLMIYDGYTYPPKLLYVKEDNEKHIEFYYRYNFNNSNSIITIKINNDVSSDIKTYVEYLILKKYLYYVMRVDLFYLKDAEYEFNISVNNSSYYIYLYGHFSKFITILKFIVSKVKYCIEILNNIENATDKQIILDIIEKQKNICREYINRSPSDKLLDIQNSIRLSNYYTKSQILEQLNKLKILKPFNVKFFTYSDIQIYIEGNIDVPPLMDIYNIVKSNYTYSPTIYKPVSINKFKNNKIYRFKNDNPTEINNMIQYISFMQVLYKTPNWLKQYCALRVFHTLVKPYFFNEMRSNQQLGYNVNSVIDEFTINNEKIVTYVLLIQSATHNCDELKVAIDKFIDTTIQKILKNISNDKDTFEKIKKTIIDNFSNNNFVLKTSFFYNYDKIIDKSYMFDLYHHIYREVHNITVEDLYKIYKQIKTHQIYMLDGLSKK
jgi:hypothetical protein